MTPTFTSAFDALRHDIMTQCGSWAGIDALETLVYGGADASLHKISSRNPCHKLLEKLTLGTDRRASGCWVWTRSLLPNGYAHLAVNGTKHYVHRLFYILTYGPIGEGLQIDHLCRNRACCRPDHLQAVTCRENLMRASRTVAARNASKDACHKGHPYAGGNLYVERYTYKGRAKYGRRCRTCRGLPIKVTGNMSVSGELTGSALSEVHSTGGVA